MDTTDKILIGAAVVGGIYLLNNFGQTFKNLNTVTNQTVDTAGAAVNVVATPINWLQAVLDYSGEGWAWLGRGFRG